jgi:hypothetical protein
MRLVLLFSLSLACSTGAMAQGAQYYMRGNGAAARAINPSAPSYVDPYIRRDGSYVGGHYRSHQNDSTFDNYSSRGNMNPFTGKRGSSDPFDIDLD